MRKPLLAMQRDRETESEKVILVTGAARGIGMAS